MFRSRKIINIPALPRYRGKQRLWPRYSGAANKRGNGFWNHLPG